MELEVIRKQLDKLDQCLDYIVMLRTPLAILVGKVKNEKNLPIYQPARETEIYNKQALFAESTGVNSDLLTHVYKLLIAEAIRIEKNLEVYDFDVDEQHIKILEENLNISEQILNDFIIQMESVKNILNSDGVKGDEFFNTVSKYYEDTLK